MDVPTEKCGGFLAGRPNRCEVQRAESPGAPLRPGAWRDGNPPPAPSPRARQAAMALPCTGAGPGPGSTDLARAARHAGRPQATRGRPVRVRCAVEAPSTPRADWRKARPIRPGGVYPAKENCSHCGLCDTYYVAHVKDACAFLGAGALGGVPLCRRCSHLLDLFSGKEAPLLQACRRSSSWRRRCTAGHGTLLSTFLGVRY